MLGTPDWFYLQSEGASRPFSLSFIPSLCYKNFYCVCKCFCFTTLWYSHLTVFFKFSLTKVWQFCERIKANLFLSYSFIVVNKCRKTTKITLPVKKIKQKTWSNGEKRGSVTAQITTALFFFLFFLLSARSLHLYPIGSMIHRIADYKSHHLDIVSAKRKWVKKF